MRQTVAKTGSDMILRTRANVRAVTGVDCDGEAWAVVANGMATLYTDFRYIPMAHRVAPALRVRDVKRFEADLRRAFGGRGAAGRRVGFDNELGDTITVTKVDECHSAEFAGFLDPSGEGYGFASVT